MSESSMTTTKVKQINKNKVYHYIYEVRTTNKQTMTQHLSMGLSTVTQNIKILEEEGLVCRNGFFESTGGRKADALEINPLARISIGGAILKDCFHWVATNLYGEPFATAVMPLPFAPTGEYYHKVAQSLETFIHDESLEREKILGIAIATQGLLDSDGFRVTYGKILDNFLMDYRELAENLPFPCRFIHDSKAAAMLGLWRHKSVKEGMVLMINRNFGGALISEGAVQHGQHGRAGAVEHLCIHPQGKSCYCGKQGCLEAYCSASALESMANTDLETFFASRHSDPKFSEIWNEYLSNLAFSIASLSLCVDGSFIISGYLSSFLIQDDLEQLHAKINSIATFPIEKEQLLLGNYGEFTQALGASLHDIDAFLCSMS